MEYEAFIFENAVAADLSPSDSAFQTRRETEANVDRSYSHVPRADPHQPLRGFDQVESVSREIYQERRENRSELRPERGGLSGSSTLWNYPDGSVRAGSSTSAPPVSTPPVPSKKALVVRTAPKTWDD